MYEEDILKELKKLNEKLGRLEELLCWNRGFGGTDFMNCLSRIMYRAEE